MTNAGNSDLDEYDCGDTYRNSYIEIAGRQLSSPSGAVTQIGNKYYVSMTGGCGGFASLVSDAIFGGSTNGGSDFPMRKLDSVSQVRPGDIIVKLNPDGSSSHILTAASRVISTKERDGVTLYAIGVYEGNASKIVHYNNYGNVYFTEELYRDHYYVAYTRYPD